MECNLERLCHVAKSVTVPEISRVKTVKVVQIEREKGAVCENV